MVIKSLKKGKYFKEKSGLKEIRVPIKIIKITQLWLHSSKSQVFLEGNIPSFASSAELRGEIHFTRCSLMYLWKNWINSAGFLDMFWLEMEDMVLKMSVNLIERQDESYT